MTHRSLPHGSKLMPALAGAAVLLASVAWAEVPSALPEEVGVDSARLVRLSEWIREQRLDVRSLLIVRDGKLIFERYPKRITREHNQSIYSVTKSVTSTLIGILVRQGRLSGTDVPVIEVLPEDVGVGKRKLEGKETILLKHVLWMASGQDWDEDPVNTPLYRAPNRLAVALGTPMKHEPGRVFNYSNADAEMAGSEVARLSGEDSLAFATRELFEPLGMKNYAWWYPDARGRYPGGWAMRLRPIDMAKLGLLYLQGGRWNDRQILTREWIERATSPGPNPRYGYFWWLGTIDRRAGSGEFSAHGWKGQFIVIHPQKELVVVMTSVLPAGREHAILSEIMTDHIYPAVRSRTKPLKATDEKQEALRLELEISARTRTRPGQSLNEQDEPRR